MMNKIKIENKIFLDENKTYYMNIKSFNKIGIVVKENICTKLVIVGNNNYDIDIKLEENSKLVVNSLNKDNNVNINIYLLENSYVIYNHSVLGKRESVNNFNLYHEKSNSTSILNNNGINASDNKLFFNINGVIPNNLTNISCSQNSKIINLNEGNSKIIPNLIINSNDVIANHSAYIGEIDDDVKFYMASRGLSLKNIQKLIYKGVMFGKMELYVEEEEFNKLINEWW